MKHFYILIAFLLGGSSLFAQTNYTCSFSANVEMDSIQVKNTVSKESKMLYSPDNTITLQQNKQQGNEETCFVTTNNANFLQSLGGNAVMVTLTRETLLRLTLYSIDGKALIHYYEKMNAGNGT